MDVDEHSPLSALQVLCYLCQSTCVEDKCPGIGCREQYREHRHYHCETGHNGSPFIVIVRTREG